MIITSNKISSYSGKIMDFILERNIEKVSNLSVYSGYFEEFNHTEHSCVIKLIKRGDLPKLSYIVNTPKKFSLISIDFRKNDAQRFTLRSAISLDGYDYYENEDIWGNAVWGKTIFGGISQTIEELENLGGSKIEKQPLQYNGPERRRLVPSH